MTTVVELPVSPVDARDGIPAQRRPIDPVAARAFLDRVRTHSRLYAYILDRLPMIAVMVVVAELAARLMLTNTTFVDEATYLGAGHLIWHNYVTSGASHTADPAFFSGAPDVYPVIANAASAIGGLVAARVLSLLFMLVAVVLLDATARELYDGRAAGWAVVLFATLEGTQFLSAFATYDAMALMLLALCTWLTVHYARSDRAVPHVGFLLGAPVLALANVTKYSSGIFDPVVIGLLTLVLAGRYGWRPAFRGAVTYVAIVAALLTAALAVGGTMYVTGIKFTTLSRAAGQSSAEVVISRAWGWVGAVGVLAGVSLVVAATRLWRDRPRDRQRWYDLAILGVLAAAIVLVPIEQARVHTIVALQKHVTFGAWFAVMPAGLLLAQVSGDRLRVMWRWLLPVALVVSLGVVGRTQASAQYLVWPNTTPLAARLAPLVENNDKPILMDDAEIPAYYLESHVSLTRWRNTYYAAATVAGSDRRITGISAFRYLIAHDYYSVIGLDYAEQDTVDRQLDAMVKLNKNYRYIGDVHLHNSYGSLNYVIWADLPASGGS